jgi:YHS domain-containing protein
MRHHRITILSAAVLLAAVLPLAALAGEGAHADHDHAEHAAADAAKTDPAEAVIAAQLPTYPLETCIVSGEPLGAMGKPVDFVHEGRLVRFCCPNCEKQFTGEPGKYLAKIDAAVIEAQSPDYPLGVCPVSGKELGAMGEPYDHVSGTRLVRFCCGGCVDTFNEDPAAYLAKIDAAAVPATEESEDAD